MTPGHGPGRGACPIGRVAADEVEGAVIDRLRAVFRRPEAIQDTWKAASVDEPDVTEDEVCEALHHVDPVQDELFTAEQARLVQLLVERVDLGQAGIAVQIRVEGFSGLAREFAAGVRRAAA